MSVPAVVGGLGMLAAVQQGLQNADDIRDLGDPNNPNSLVTRLNNLGGVNDPNFTNLNQDSQFKGYGVTSNLGTSKVGADGSVNVGVGQNAVMQDSANAYNQSGLQAMSNAMQGTAGREQDIYNRMMAMQNPALNRAQAAQQAREYAMGRGGVRGSQFGGTAEDAAMARARAEASNQASVAAMQQAQQEMMNQGQLAQAYGQMANQNYQTSFLPMQQQMELMQLGGNNADRSQTGQLTGLQYLAQLALGGSQVGVNAMKTASELEGNLYDSVLDNLSSQYGILSYI